MKSVSRIFLAVVCITFVVSALAQTPAPAKPKAPAQASALVDRVGMTGFLQLQAGSFNLLDPKQKELAFWLTQASIAIDPIIYD